MKKNGKAEKSWTIKKDKQTEKVEMIIENRKFIQSNKFEQLRDN